MAEGNRGDRRPEGAEGRVLEELGRGAGDLADLPDRLGDVSDHLAETCRVLDSLVAETGSLARLDETITVLAETVQPLQGASERVGRLVDLLPESRRRRPRDTSAGGPEDDASTAEGERPAR